jgi:hypothetical protein
MKSKKQIIRFSKAIGAFLFSVFIFNACGIAPGCWGEDKNSGIIQESLNVACSPRAEQKQFVITSDSMYKSMFDSTCALTAIDFNQYSLLGQYASGTCTMKFKRDVRSDADRKAYVYKLIAKDCGLCKKMQIAYNWVKVPKLPEGWTVRFELKEK